MKWKFLPWTHEIPPWGGIPPRLGTIGLANGKIAPVFNQSGSAKGEIAGAVLFAADGKIGIAKNKKA